MWVVRIMDLFFLVAEHCADSGHTFASQNAEILREGNDRLTRETIEACCTKTTSINRCVAHPAVLVALRTMLIERKSKQEISPNVIPAMGEPITGMHVTTPQAGSDEDAVINTAASTTSQTDENPFSQKDANRTSNPERY
ncbi:unnamed protein product [Schistocephalus solidus]|uniref:Secreted protein n=1 Tax=Schistocephalus solidus TaxID=70667 RepID=A0A183SBZ7_SCHSO|nr:unnamed protein product [Schistocephalus solidus]